MKQAIAGVSPASTSEVTVMTVWPSIACYWLGRQMGKLFDIRWPNVYFFRLGNLLALLSIPLALPLYFARLLPTFYGVDLRGYAYRVTNRRVCVLQNNITHNNAQVPLGMSLAVVMALIGGVLAWLITSWIGLAMTWKVGITAAVVLLGAAKWFLIGCWKFELFQVDRAVALDQFDRVEVEVQPGQAWYDAGDLVFRKGGIETFRLPGVSRPESFRHVCLKAHLSYIGVQRSLQNQKQPVPA